VSSIGKNWRDIKKDENEDFSSYKLALEISDICLLEIFLCLGVWVMSSGENDRQAEGNALLQSGHITDKMARMFHISQLTTMHMLRTHTHTVTDIHMYEHSGDLLPVKQTWVRSTG